MGYLTIARIRGNQDSLLRHYRSASATMDAVGRDHGIIVHAAGGTENGLLMVNLWPSKQAADAATADQRRLAVLDQLPITPDQLEHEHHDLERWFLP